VVSISWGQSEDQWTAQARNALDQAFAEPPRSASRCASRRATTAAPTARTTAPRTSTSPRPAARLACGGTSLRLNTDGTTQSEEV